MTTADLKIQFLHAVRNSSLTSTGCDRVQSSWHRARSESARRRRTTPLHWYNCSLTRRVTARHWRPHPSFQAGRPSSWLTCSPRTPRFARRSTWAR